MGSNEIGPAWQEDFRVAAHTTSLTCLAFNADASTLATGSSDSDIVIWDMVASQGVCRLKGHKDRVTALAFLNKSSGTPLLVSTSKDTLVKFWELETQHCIQTLIGSKREIWGLAIDPNERRLVVGSVDNELRVWNIESLSDQGSSQKLYERKISFLGSIIRRHGNKRVFSLRFDESGRFLAVHGDDYFAEVFSVHLPGDTKQSRSERKSKKSAATNGGSGSFDLYAPVSTGDDAVGGLGDSFQRFGVLHINSKLRSLDFHPQKPHTLLISTAVNYMEEWTIANAFSQPKQHETDKKKKKSKKSTPGAEGSDKESQLKENACTNRIFRHGHRNPIRAVAISHDDRLIATASNDSLKIWNASTGHTTQTIECGYALSAVFLPGNKFVIVGTKDGHLELFDLAANQRVDMIAAHKGPIYSICLKPNARGIISGSADKTVKMWDFEVENADRPKLGLTLDQTLVMNDEVLCVKASKDSKFLAVALLDTTVKVFYQDTLKFFVSLYGHKLPVMSMDISADSTIIATGSSDKNIKIWGLDFGDCHKSIFAHDDGITSLGFAGRTHYLFSCSKDGSVKYWDADTYDMAQEVRAPGNDATLWSMVISSDGEHIIAAGQERAVYFWERSDEQLFLEEEQERRMEQQLEKQLEQSHQFVDITTGLRGARPDQGVEAVHPGLRTLGAIETAEQLTADINLVMEEITKMDEWATACRLQEQGRLAANIPPINTLPPKPNLLLLGKQPDEYLWTSITRIKRAQLDVVLSLLSYSHAKFLLRIIARHLEQLTGTTPNPEPKRDNAVVFSQRFVDIELATSIVLLLLHIHHCAVISDVSLVEPISLLSRILKDRLRQEKDTIGFNIAALQTTQQVMKDSLHKDFKEIEQVEPKQAQQARDSKRKRLDKEQQKGRSRVQSMVSGLRSSGWKRKKSEE